MGDEAPLCSYYVFVVSFMPIIHLINTDYTTRTPKDPNNTEVSITIYLVIFLTSLISLPVHTDFLTQKHHRKMRFFVSTTAIPFHVFFKQTSFKKKSAFEMKKKEFITS
jgi:hypothetical protein